MQYKLGADPEIFVGDATSVRSIIGKIGGSKDHPLALPIGEGFAVQEDNVALEFNIPASGSKQEFISNICKATDFLEQSMKDRYGLHFVKESAVSFPKEEMYDPGAFIFGCEPDFNAWTRSKNPRPKANDPLLRSCGGHVHVGVDGVDPLLGTKALDLFLAVPAVKMDRGLLRKELYGKAGAFRPKPYGFEYRVLSNFWVFDPKLIGWVHDNVGRALDSMRQIDFDSEQENILNAINNNDVALADQLINKYQLQVV